MWKMRWMIFVIPNIFQLRLILKSSRHQHELFHLHFFVYLLDEQSTNKLHLALSLEDQHRMTIYLDLNLSRDMRDTEIVLWSMIDSEIMLKFIPCHCSDVSKELHYHTKVFDVLSLFLFPKQPIFMNKSKFFCVKGQREIENNKKNAI